MVCVIIVSNHQDMSSRCKVTIIVTNGVCFKTKRFSDMATIAYSLWVSTYVCAIQIGSTN